MIREAGRISDGHFLRLFDSEEKDLLAGNSDRGGGKGGRIDGRTDGGELVLSSNGEDVSDGSHSQSSSGSETEEQEAKQQETKQSGNSDDRVEDRQQGGIRGNKMNRERGTARYSLEDVYDCWDEMLR